MISSTKAEALAILSELCELAPDIRLGQLFAHLGFLGDDQAGKSLWNIDDEDMLSVLHRHRLELLSRLPENADSTTSCGQ